MFFMDYLEEFCWYIICLLVVIIIVGIVLFIFCKWYFSNVILGLVFNDFFLYGWFCDFLKVLGVGEVFCMMFLEFKI